MIWFRMILIEFRFIILSSQAVHTQRVMLANLYKAYGYYKNIKNKSGKYLYK